MAVVYDPFCMVHPLTPASGGHCFFKAFVQNNNLCAFFYLFSATSSFVT
jgi:hypothetical protein